MTWETWVAIRKRHDRYTVALHEMLVQRPNMRIGDQAAAVKYVSQLIARTKRHELRVQRHQTRFLALIEKSRRLGIGQGEHE
jgi:hypothetical protein